MKKDINKGWSKSWNKPWEKGWQKIGQQNLWNQGSYDYGFNRKLQSLDGNVLNKDWETEEWQGYESFKAPQLDYRYVEQMANAFAARYKIRVEIGKCWSIDLKNRVLTYDPKTLMTGTKAHLICCLLHEIGHLRHSTHQDELISKYLHKYGNNSFLVFNVFEDFRIDKMMSKAYEGAEDVFEANKPIIKKIASDYRRKSEIARQHVTHQLLRLEREYSEGMKDNFEKGLSEKEVLANIDEVRKKIRIGRDTFFDYCAEMSMIGYGMKEPIADDNLRARVEKTEEAIELSVKADSSQSVVSMLDEKVYPIIEDLLDEFNPDKGNKLIKKKLGVKVARIVARRLKQEMEHQASQIEGQGQGHGQQVGLRASMSSGHGVESVIRDWESGDYDKLKRSVMSTIEELARKLFFLRKKERTFNWQSRQKRGRLETKRLYKHRLGESRLFKKKTETTDTISSFAFSLFLDISGSMYRGGSIHNPIVHSTRGLIVFLEVFEKLNIPFEVIVFGSQALMMKRFDETTSRAIKRKIGGIPTRDGGYTNLYRVFDVTQIEQQSEKNKIVIILSDGGVSSNYDYKKKFKQWDKKRILSLGLGIACRDEIQRLCLGNGFAIDEPFELPDKFSELVKSLLNL